MNSLEKIKPNTYFLLIMLLFVSSSLFAQMQQGPPRVPSNEEIQNLVADLSNELSLTNEQKTDIENLFVKHFEDVRQHMEENKEQMNAEREDREQHRKEFEDSIKELLTEDQQAHFVEFMKNHRPDNQQNNQPRKSNANRSSNDSEF